MALAWKHIGLYGHSVGTFTADPSGIQWKFEDDSISTVKFLPGDSLRMAKWTVFGRSGHLRITSISPSKQKSGSSSLKTHEYRFDGFPPSEFERISKTLKKLYNLDVMKHTMSSSGYSFGKADISGSHLVYRKCIVDDEETEEGQDGDEMLTLDLTEVSQCVLPGNNRNEIELQFHESDTVEQGTDQCVQIRFYVPPEPDADPDAPTNAELFQQRIMTKAQIKNTTGNVIAEFDEQMGTFLTPRGRYAIELYDSFLRLRGSKYDYKIKYDDISRLFLLPKPDEVHMAFVIALDKPIRQGQQRYSYLVLQTNKEPSQVAISLDEQTLQREYNGGLQPVMTGSLSNLIAKTFKVITKKKVFVPGKFTNSNQQECVKCALRANDGHLYPLEKQLIFIHKPALLIRFDEVQHVEFQRYAGGQGSTRNFDLCVTLKNVSDDSSLKQEYTFSGIDRTDYTPLHNFLVGKKIKILNIQDPGIDAGPNLPEYNEDVIYGLDQGKSSGGGRDDDADSSSDDTAYKSGQDESESDDDSSDGDDDDDISEGTDEDLEEARRQNKKLSSATKASSSAQQTNIKRDKSDGSIAKKTKKRERPEEPRKTTNTKQPKKPKKTKKTKKTEDSDDENDSQTVSSKNSKKGKKDPNAPKKGSSAYMFFVKRNRPKFKEKNPDASFGDLSRLIAKKYKELDAEEREVYEDLARKDKKRYEKEMENYSPPKDDRSLKGNKKKQKKDPNAPKKPLNAYNYFCQANRPKILEKNPNASFSEVSKMQSEAYKKLSSEQMKKYEAKAKADKDRYQKQMKTYNAKNSATPKETPKKKAEPKSESDSSSDSDNDSDSDSDSD